MKWNGDDFSALSILFAIKLNLKNAQDFISLNVVRCTFIFKYFGVSKLSILITCTLTSRIKSIISYRPDSATQIKIKIVSVTLLYSIIRSIVELIDSILKRFGCFCY